jgi:hypothetical protein
MPTISVFFESSWRKTSAISSSFHTHSRLTTPRVTTGAAERGNTTRRKTRHDEQPSITAASIMLAGIVRKKFVSM